VEKGFGCRCLRLFAIATSVLTMLLAATGPTSAAQLNNNTAPPTGTDSKQGIVMRKTLDTGKRVDLSKDWGEVTACAVASTTSTRCYATEAEMDAAEAQFAEEAGSVSPALACDGWLGRNRWVKLYEHINFNQGQSGRVLQFNDANYWQNLADWNFANMTTSISNETGCLLKVSEYPDGQAAQSCMEEHVALGYVGDYWQWAPFKTRNDDIDAIYIHDTIFNYC
jgi:hypothetical protein